MATAAKERSGNRRQSDTPGSTVEPTPDSVQPGRDSRPRRQLDFAALRATGLIPAEHERQLFSRVFRGIKRPLLATMDRAGRETTGNARPNILMVASAIAGDGKTFTTLNLAICFALERDRHVVLVDGDVVKRGLSQELGFSAEPGLIDLLHDPARLPDECTIQTDIPRLSVLPAGSASMNATELLSSTRMRQIAAHYAASEDCVVIFDSPPLLLTSESRALAELAGQVVMVVREGQTTQPMLMQALGMLQGCPSVSLVLNQSLAVPHAGYGYGYKYEDGENLGEHGE